MMRSRRRILKRVARFLQPRASARDRRCFIVNPSHFAKRDRLRSLVVKSQLIRAERKFPKANWVTPAVLVDAEFRGKTADGLLRHPSYKGIREDLMSELQPTKRSAARRVRPGLSARQS
jgi:hypothetical protein